MVLPAHKIRATNYKANGIKITSFNDAFSILQAIIGNGKMILNNELEMIWKEMVVAYTYIYI
jgi:hypothetical protein